MLRQKVSGLLFSHLEKVSSFVDSLPFITSCFPDKAQRQRITMSCFVELIVLRFALLFSFLKSADSVGGQQRQIPVLR